MIDLLITYAPAVAALLGAMAGVTFGRAIRPRTARPNAALCSCEHGYGTHDGDGGACTGQIRREHYMPTGIRSGYEWVDCPCGGYIGPNPTIFGGTL